MSLHLTKPKWHRGPVVATEQGWVNPINNEVLIAIGNLKSKLEAEGKVDTVISLHVQLPISEATHEPVINVEIINEPVILESKEVKMEVQEKNKKVIGKKPKIIGEVVERDLTKQIIAEVVEYDIEQNVIAE